MKKHETKKGFTLIELLIVIAIIAILAVAFLPTLLGAPAKARDTKRVADIQKIQSFLQSYTLGGKALPVSNCIDNSATAGDGTIGKIITNSIADFGGVYPIDPKTDVTPTGALKACAGQYGFIRFAASVKNYSGVVYSYIETQERANIKCGQLNSDTATPVLTPGTVDISTGGGGGLYCYAVYIQ